MTNQPLPAHHFTPDGIFLLKPKHRDVALGLKPYPQKITLLFSFAISLLMGILILAIPLAFAVHSWRSYQALSERQAMASAEITDKRISRGEDTDTYYITYSFTYPDRNGEPQQYRKEISTSADTFRQTQIGQRIRVYFTPDDPTISQTTPVAISDTFVPTAILVGTTIGVGIALFLSVRHFLSEFHLARHGRLLPGILLDVKGEDGDETYAITVRYQFQSPQGVTLDSKFADAYVNKAGDVGSNRHEA